MRLLDRAGRPARGLDLKPGPFTDIVGDIADPDLVDTATDSIAEIVHTATLHKPHVVTHSQAAFVRTNITGTLTLLEAAVRRGMRSVIFTSTTSAFGAALSPGPGSPAAWIDETVQTVPKNIYGATKTAAETLCHLTHRRNGMPVIVLRTSRFFPEEDDNPAIRAAFTDENAKANEFLYRRVDIEDAAFAHLDALGHAEAIGFGVYVISATTPFRRDDLAGLRSDPGAVVARYHPAFERVYSGRNFRMFRDIGRVYDSARARADLGWTPKWDFARVLTQIEAEEPIGSDLARAVGSKGYHDRVFEDGPFPVA